MPACIGRGGGVSTAEGVSEDKLSTVLVPDVKGVAPEGSEKPQFLGADGGVDRPARGEGSGRGGIISVDKHDLRTVIGDEVPDSDKEVNRLKLVDGGEGRHELKDGKGATPSKARIALNDPHGSDRGQQQVAVANGCHYPPGHSTGTSQCRGVGQHRPVP